MSVREVSLLSYLKEDKNKWKSESGELSEKNQNNRDIDCRSHSEDEIPKGSFKNYIFRRQTAMETKVKRWWG